MEKKAAKAAEEKAVAEKIASDGAKGVPASAAAETAAADALTAVSVK